MFLVIFRAWIGRINTVLSTFVGGDYFFPNLILLKGEEFLLFSLFISTSMLKLLSPFLTCGLASVSPWIRWLPPSCPPIASESACSCLSVQCRGAGRKPGSPFMRPQLSTPATGFDKKTTATPKIEVNHEKTEDGWMGEGHFLLSRISYLGRVLKRRMFGHWGSKGWEGLWPLLG